MPLPQRWLTSLMVRYNGRSILLDCGEGTQIAMKKRGWSPNPIDLMLFTHYHADHISGLPGMLLSMGNAERTEPLLMVGPKGLQKVVDEDQETFDLPGEKDFHITAYRVNHRVPCYCYNFVLDRAGRFDAARAREQEIPLAFWSRLQKGETIEENGRVFTPDMVMGPERKGLKVAYATDSRPCAGIVSPRRRRRST